MLWAVPTVPSKTEITICIFHLPPGADQPRNVGCPKLASLEALDASLALCNCRFDHMVRHPLFVFKVPMTKLQWENNTSTTVPLKHISKAL